MIDVNELEAASCKDEDPSSYIPAGSWHRENRVLVMQQVLGEDNFWGTHLALMELSNQYGYVAITIQSLADTIGISESAVKRSIQSLTDKKLWAKHYDKHWKLLELQVNPTIAQKFNCADLEAKAIESWETLTHKASGKILNHELSLEQARGYVKLQSELALLKSSLREPNMKEPSVLYQYLAMREYVIRTEAAEKFEAKENVIRSESADKLQAVEERLSELTGYIQELLKKFVPAEEAEAVKRHLKLVTDSHESP